MSTPPPDDDLMTGETSKETLYCAARALANVKIAMEALGSVYICTPVSEQDNAVVMMRLSAWAEQLNAVIEGFGPDIEPRS